MVTVQRHKEAMERINSLLNVRERCIKEIRMRLCKAGFSDEEVEDALQAALRVNLLNEERYARAFIRGKVHLGWGRAKIVQRLHADGIADDVIECCQDDFASPCDEYQMAQNELSKRPARSKNPYATYVRRLLGRGFSMDLSKRVAADYLSQNS